MARRPSKGPKNVLTADLPEPPARDLGLSIRAWIWALVSCAVLAGIAFWFTRPPQEKQNLLNFAADEVNHLLSQTPLAGLGDILRDTPPPPPIHGENPRGLPGTLSGAVVRGGIGAPSQDEASDSKTYFPESFVSPAREDQNVRPGHISSLANWLVKRYKPGPNGGELDVSVRALNTRASAGFGDSARGGRAALLRYAFNPAMIDGLYSLYIDRFMADLNVGARTRGFSLQENRNFHLALAHRAAALAQTLEILAEEPDLSNRMARIESFGRQAVDLNTQMNAAIGELEKMQKDNAPQKQRETMQMRITGLDARYRRSLDDMAAEKRNLAAQLRQNAGQGLDEDSLIYLASWVARRLAAKGEAREALKSAARALRDLAHRCAESGG